MNVQIPVKWLQELLALCGPEDHELRERVMVSITAMDEQAARAVAMPEPFTTLVRKNSWSPSCYEASPRSNSQEYGRQWADERINVYTEQQVRALLATGGQAQAQAQAQAEYLPLLIRDIARDLGITSVDACAALNREAREQLARQHALAHDLLARIRKEIDHAAINNHRTAPALGRLTGEPCVKSAYLEATIEGWMRAHGIGAETK